VYLRDRGPIPTGLTTTGPLRSLKTAMSKVHPKINTLLWALLPQADGSPALQSLVMCLYFITSGVATNLLKILYEQASNILMARAPLYDR
jgi:hypothetical protein